LTAIITIRQDREKPVRNQHPWIFSGAIDRIEGNPTPGDIVTVVNQKRTFLARGYYNPKSQINVRILTWHDEEINEDWWRQMLQRAIDARRKFMLPMADGSKINPAFRVVNAENDFIPGLIVDRYGDWLVLQALTLGIDQRKALITELLAEIAKPTGIFERSDVDVRGKEGLKPETGILWGEEPPDRIVIDERFVKFQVNLRTGHKTGFYLDQRENRDLLFGILFHHCPPMPQLNDNFDRPPCRVLNLFSYTGGFGLYALTGGVDHVINVDASREALELAEENFTLNHRPLDRAEFIQADVFDYLHDMRDAGEQYDVIVCDPPKFAQSAQQVDKAARGYKDLNLNAFHCIKPGGYLMTFSCSGAISADLFQKIVFGALADSGRQAQILRHLGPGDDHPVALTFPEGAYLKGLLLRVY
jgi:23S rRNA (cytosine1962-C5)-methyltransferase